MNLIYIFGSIILVILLFYSIATKHKTVKRIFAFVTLATLFAYIIWRGFFTLPFETPLSAVTGIVLYLAEIVGLFVFAFFVFLFARQKPEVVQPPLQDNFRPKVCVFVCTYNEDIKLVLATAHAAKVLKYPNKAIYVCDDGHREALRTLCKKFDIHYLSRPDNAHAKAGNINYALSQTKSELFMVLDADFIVKQKFIYEAVSFFQDKKVALVQYPQTFYNKDPFQLMRGTLFNEQELFMRFQEPALAKENAMIHVGTNAILRRSAVEAIGGIPTKSITEDMATGLLLQNAGYKTRYINKAYALGITPYNVADLAAQRSRWAKGTMQIFRSYKPFRLKGLGFLQKLCYFNAYLYWFSSFQKLIYMVAPTLFMLFQIFIVKSSLQEMLLFFLLPILMIMLSFRLYIPHVRTFSMSHMYDSFVAPIHARALLKEAFHEEKIFKVTKKDITTRKSFDFRTVCPHIVIAVWIFAALAFAVFKLLQGTPYLYGYLITSAWSVYNLYGLFWVILAAKPRDIISDADALSITIDEDILIENQHFNAYQLSYNGGRIRANGACDLAYFNPGQLYQFEVARTGLKISARCTDTTNDYAAFSFENLTPKTANHLAAFYSEQLHAAKPCCE